jgi:hypothetical protein
MYEEFIELEQRFWRAAGDPDFYRQRFADDGVMAFHIGLMGKPEVVEAMAGAAEWSTFTMDDLRFVEITDDVVSLTYTTVAVPADSHDEYRAAVTSVYVRRGGEWMLVIHQQSPLAN